MRCPSPFFLLPLLLVACVPASLPSPVFFYLRMAASPSLVLQRSPDSAQPLKEIPLVTPSGWNFWSLTPAPDGRSAVIEWQCSYGPAVQLLNVEIVKANCVLVDDGLENR